MRIVFCSINFQFLSNRQIVAALDEKLCVLPSANPWLAAPLPRARCSSNVARGVLSPLCFNRDRYTGSNRATPCVSATEIIARTRSTRGNSTPASNSRATFPASFAQQ